MMDRSRSFRSLCLASALLLVGVFGLSGPAEGAGVAGVAGKVLWELGKKVGAFAIEYLAGKVVDQKLGLDYETQLKQVEANLLAEIRRNPESSHAVQAELASARSQIRVLNAVLRSKPSAQELSGLRAKMTSDLQQVKRLLEQHGIRLDQHDHKLAEHDRTLGEHGQTLGEHGRTLEDLGSRIERLEDRQEGSFRLPEIEERETSPDWREPADEISPREEAVPEWRSRVPRQVPSYETREPRYREPAAPPQGEGISLTIEVRCNSCTVEIRETDSVGAADRGSFEVRRARERRSFRLLAGTGAVITILGDNNRIRVPAGVGRIRVRDLGENNRKLDMK